MVQQYLRLLSDGHWQQTFVSDLISEIVTALRYPVEWDPTGATSWDEYDALYGRRITRTTLASCCLVCYEWNQLFTPALYESIAVDHDKLASLLLRTLWYDQPARKELIHTIEVQCDQSSNDYYRKGVKRGSMGERNIFTHIYYPKPSDFFAGYNQTILILLPKIYLSTTVGIGKSQAEFTFPRIRKDEDIVAVNSCLAYMAHHTETLYLSFTGSLTTSVDFDFQHNTALRSLRIGFPSNVKHEPNAQWLAILPWFQSVCSTVTTSALTITIESPAEELDICLRIEDAILDIEATGRVAKLCVELGKVWEHLPGGEAYWGERFPRIHGRNILTVH
ncbi:hypothetical protein QCA50_007231 [Cerrena zonata]|uniref:F-box domain-containing protein n=1 Tax=Cerrena zonata TaxID=2478898 RepID=A0AAW0GI61_9APHY